MWKGGGAERHAADAAARDGKLSERVLALLPGAHCMQCMQPVCVRGRRKGAAWHAKRRRASPPWRKQLMLLLQHRARSSNRWKPHEPGTACVTMATSFCLVSHAPACARYHISRRRRDRSPPAPVPSSPPSASACVMFAVRTTGPQVL